MSAPILRADDGRSKPAAAIRPAHDALVCGLGHCPACRVDDERAQVAADATTRKGRDSHLARLQALAELLDQWPEDVRPHLTSEDTAKKTKLLRRIAGALAPHLDLDWGRR